MEDKVLIGIGSNIGNGIKNCMMAIKKISSDRRIDMKSISSFYSTSPVSDIKQDNFINCAVRVSWDGTPNELMELLSGIEKEMGRTTEVRNGPRIIDLDILLFGTVVLDEPSLTIPHKQLHKRKFAIIPCVEIDPNCIVPTFKKPLKDFLAEIGEDQVVKKLEWIVFSDESEEE
jgi:2-amino-4-hydroxy-6-hydroxymethyldihydropteridine diphosphokinase